MCTFDKSHPLAGMCSPPLMGSSGVCPLVIIATIPKICCHMSNLIAKAQKEVFLATNFGKYLEGSRLICNALRELSKRALSGSRRVVVKVMYDRGDPNRSSRLISSSQPTCLRIRMELSGCHILMTSRTSIWKLSTTTDRHLPLSTRSS